MNTKRLLLAILASFIFIFVSEFLIHGVWMLSDYHNTAALWRSEAEMNARVPWMFAAQLLCAITFVVLWVKGFAVGATIQTAILYGVLMSLFSQVNTIVMYVVSPLPCAIACKWFFSGLLQGVVLGLIAFFVYKPATLSTRSA